MTLWPLAALLLLAGPGETSSERTTVLVRQECVSEIGRREVTLFANGTVRLREGLRGQEVMTLGELGRGELEAILRRFADEDLRETDLSTQGVEGAWVERCSLELALAGEPERRLGYGRYDSLSLPLSRVLRIVEDIARAADPRARQEHLPAGYQARLGDRLRRVDGELFEVTGFTSDHRGVELQGVDQPLTLYVLKEELPREFVSLVPRREAP